MRELDIDCTRYLKRSINCLSCEPLKSHQSTLAHTQNVLGVGTNGFELVTEFLAKLIAFFVFFLGESFWHFSLCLDLWGLILTTIEIGDYFELASRTVGLPKVLIGWSFLSWDV